MYSPILYLPASPTVKAGLRVGSARLSVHTSQKSCHRNSGLRNVGHPTLKAYQRNSSEISQPIVMKLGMLQEHHW